ncbi:DDE-type integrase/transposase/recombinase [Amphibacillus xylanus]|uniref:Putative transposase n=1 Tax=Amphibacillus xylanus (strain ATCC 51415 / DSM 6626 / JCM 7361 / LMG 17667 / NBRC 15112 / Ep01) TaxID=698758 RepID=K0J7K4_AMPXN|nr:DDE-type integrase/transposase/recombinase [Amphibacillus xylanus]BAM47523.1 putative transposase [Amphibacillus xylanus NBRC 15112]
MYPQFITYLLQFIKFQEKIIYALLGILLGKSVAKAPFDEPVNKPYRKLQVDDMPVIETLEKLDYKKLIHDYKVEHGKVLKPITRRKNSVVTVPETLTCPKCSAPSEYLYANNGNSGQYKCKVCACLFSKQNRFLKEAIIKCPHCLKTLERIKERRDFYVYKCKNNNCSFYKKNLRKMTKEEKQQFKNDPQAFKVRYIFREFNFDFKPLAKESPISPKVDLSKIYVSPHTLGLILTYHVNYGLSARKTAALMYDVHGVKISHQTILNYMNSVALITKPFVDHYPYELSNSFCGDETYIRVKGKWHYLFFFFDAVKKIILSYPVSPNRDTPSAIKALDQVLQKFKEIPEDLMFVVDGNPIYILAQHYFAQHGIHFDIHKVIGLTNEDPVSKEYRPLKQIIERLNRSFKGNYRATTGFGSQEGSVSYVTLFVAYFNFLRPHASLENKVPVMIPELEMMPNMPERWTKLISMAQDFLAEQQAA